MCSYIVLVLVSIFVTTISTAEVEYVDVDPVIDGTELVFAFMVHRHGDRTPVKETSGLVKNENAEEIAAVIEPWGYGQLTDAGKKTGYATGKFIRRRYDDLLGAKYNKSEIYIRSTDSTRTKMTVLAAMSAVYPATNNSWNSEINWEPIPYTTVPCESDFNLAIVNCPTYMSAFFGALMSPNPRMNRYRIMINQLSKIIGYDLTRNPAMISQVHDYYTSLMSLGYSISKDVTRLLPKIKDAAGTAWDITGDKKYWNLGAGVLLKEFFDNANAVISGSDTQKVRVYSAHDINVYALEAISQVSPKQGAPKYGSLFSLELRKVINSGQYMVLPVYLSDPHNENSMKYLSVKGCGGGFLCDYDKFYSTTSKYLLDEKSWRQKCGITPNFKIDTSSID